MTLRLVRTVQTSVACPSQWDAWDAEGNYYYLRYRHGRGQIRQYKTADWVDSPDDELIRCVAEFEYGGPHDGDIKLDDFAGLAGIEIEPVAFRTGFGEHVRDELIKDGMVMFLETGGDDADPR